MAQFLKPIYHTVYLMLGNSCNMNCRYCVQHPLVHEPIAREIDPEIYQFLEELSKNMPAGDKLPIEFYGGEPLLYFEAMKKIVEHTEGFCRFSIISNGKNITDEQVNFINRHHISYRVSWDGRNVLKTRMEDVLRDAKNKNKLLHIEDFGISAVTSKYATPRDIFDAFQPFASEYWMLHGRLPYVNTDEVMDVGAMPRDFLDADYGKIRNEVYGIVAEYLDGRRHLLSIESRWAESMVEIAEDNEWSPRDEYAPCGNGYDTLNLDLQGSLYACHNLSSPIADIHTPYFEYLGRIIATDSTLKHKDACRKCSVFKYCGGGCKFVSEKAKKESYCKLKKAVFEPVLQALEERQGVIDKTDSL